VRLVDPELELPLRVSAEDHDDDAVTTPSPLGIGTASENVLPGNDAMPCNVVIGPAVGLNMIVHSGVFSPPFPLPYELKGTQSKVTDPQVAVAVTMHADALAAKTASVVPASANAWRERRTVARLLPTCRAARVSLSVFMLALLSGGRVLDLRRHGGEIRARRRATRSCAAMGPPTSASAGWFPTRASGA
jgi:hypothetical protein